MSKLTRRLRYQRTASALRHILHFGSAPDTRATYYDGYTPFELWQDSYGAWIKLIRGNRFIAIVDFRSVRCIRSTIYLTILEDFAKRTGRRFIVADSLTPTSKRFTPIRRTDSTFGERDVIPFNVNRHGRTSRRADDNMPWHNLTITPPSIWDESSVVSPEEPVLTETIDLSEIPY